MVGEGFEAAEVGLAEPPIVGCRAGEGDDGWEVVEGAGGGAGFADGAGDAAVADGEAGADGVDERVEWAGEGGSVAVGQAAGVGFVGGLDEQVRPGGGVFGAEEDSEAGAGVGAGIGWEEAHDAAVHADGAAEVAAGVAGAGVGDDPGEPEGHRGLPSVVFSRVSR